MLDGLRKYDVRRPLAPTGANSLGLIKHITSLQHTAVPPFVKLPTDATGMVPWWPDERRHVTLHEILVHMVAERAQHLGHTDILRELLDSTAGQCLGDPNLTPRSPEEWPAHRAVIEAAGRQA